MTGRIDPAFLRPALLFLQPISECVLHQDAVHHGPALSTGFCVHLRRRRAATWQPGFFRALIWEHELFFTLVVYRVSLVVLADFAYCIPYALFRGMYDTALYISDAVELFRALSTVEFDSLQEK